MIRGLRADGRTYPIPDGDRLGVKRARALRAELAGWLEGEALADWDREFTQTVHGLLLQFGGVARLTGRQLATIGEIRHRLRGLATVRLGDIAAAALLAELAEWTGDPRLSVWEENFIADMRVRLAAYRGANRLSPAQLRTLEELRRDMARPPVAANDDDLDTEAEDDGDDPPGSSVDDE